MPAILLEPGSETGLFRECRYTARRQFLPCACRSWWAPARLSFVPLGTVVARICVFGRQFKL
ncbi:MAG: hypothetical protein CR217_09140 [Beijerinckiaceae bacterium]|nr:MAG: hypothetical protein CR217_09140 [Beijerinckiaceae bacterium]